MRSQCEQIKIEYEQIKTLAQEFVLEYQKAEEAGMQNLERVKELRAELERKRGALKEKLWAFEALPLQELKAQQYESQKDILQRIGVLETLSHGELGIKAIDGREYQFPSFQDIQRAMMEQKRSLQPKTEQGFDQMLIIPFGMKLDDLIEKYKEVIIRHYREGKLFATKEKPSDPDEALALNESEPVWVWEKYRNADTSGELVYFPEKFHEKEHRGKTKMEILGGSPDEHNGFFVLLIENLPNIPRKGKGKKINGRKQPEANSTPAQYLNDFRTDPHYQHETGMTPEEQIMYAITHLERANQVIDDWQGKGSVSYQLGAYFPASGNVPNAYWNRVNRRAGLGGGDPGFSDARVGGRGVVRVKIKI